jgi:O-antigen/teichoic acid export membrane protein
MLSGMLLELNTRVDVWMLSNIKGDERMVGTYVVALQVVEGIFQLLIVLQSNYNPVIAQHVAERRLPELEVVIARGKRYTYLLFGAIALVAIPLFPWAVEVLMGNPEYRAGWLPFGLLIGGIVVSAGYQPFFQTLLMANRPGWHNAFMLATLLANVIGNGLLIPRYGMEGAALATAGSFVVSVFVLKAIVRRQVGVRL